MSTLTAANSKLTISIPGLYNAPVLIKGYAVDDAFTLEDVEPTETRMGVDGILSGGYTPYPVPIEITLQADSISNDVFEFWNTTQDTEGEASICNATLQIPGIGKEYILTRGFLTKSQQAPTGKKLLEPRKYTITFNKITVAPI